MRRSRMAEEPISQELLDVLACPVYKERVELMGEELVCAGCDRKYLIEGGIPRMLPDELR